MTKCSRKVLESAKYYQILIPKELVDKVLRSLRGDFGKHPGITKTINAYREKNYFTKITQLTRARVMSCEHCIKEVRTGRSLTRHQLQIPNENITALEDAMRKDLVPEVPPSDGYENFVTAKDVFSRYLIAYPTFN